MGLISKAFSDIITFSRSSNATRVGPDGTVQYAPHNLITYSEQFENAAWTANNSTVSANAIASPSGTVTGDRLTEDSSNTDHKTRQTFTFTAVPQTFSAYVKAAERTCVALQAYDGTTLFGYIFNLATGGLGSRVSGSSTNVTGAITAVGNGWYRCSITFTPAAAAGQVNVALASNTTTVTYTGDGASGAYFWGAQLSRGVIAGDYTPTTSAAVYGPRFDYDPVTYAAKGLLIEEQRTNICLYSEDLTNAVWTKDQSTIVSNTVTAPDGTLTADLMQENTATASHQVFQTMVATAAPYTFSVYLKAAGRNWAFIRFDDASIARYAYFNLSTGVTGTVDGFYSASSITPVGNGWYRCSVTVTATAANWYSVIASSTGNSVTSYTGDGSSGIYVWGVQVEAGPFATSYIPTVASTVTRSADVASVNTLSPWFNATEGTLFAEHQAIYPSQGNVVASINDNSANRSMELQHRGSTPSTNFASFTVVSGSITGQADAGSSATYSAIRKWAGAYKTNDFASSQNGGAIGSDVSGAVPSGLTQMQLMTAYWASSALTSGWLRRVAYYPRRLTNAELQTLTA